MAMKLPEIEKFARDYVLPNDIVLNQASTIRDTEMFFDSHIATLKGNTSRRIKILHYERLIKTIEIIKLQGLVRKDGVEEKPIVSVEKNNTLDVPDSVETDEAIKPNSAFDSGSKPMKPNEDFDSEKPVKIERPIPEPQRITVKEIPKKKEPPKPNQTSLF